MDKEVYNSQSWSPHSRLPMELVCRLSGSELARKQILRSNLPKSFGLAGTIYLSALTPKSRTFSLRGEHYRVTLSLGPKTFLSIQRSFCHGGLFTKHPETLSAYKEAYTLRSCCTFSAYVTCECINTYIYTYLHLYVTQKTIIA